MKSFLRFLAFCFFFAAGQPVSHADSCNVFLPDAMTLQSSYNGDCKAGLAHGYGKVVAGKIIPKTGKKLVVTYEGIFQSGRLTGSGKETEESGLYRYEGTFNNWKRWTGTAHIAQTAQDQAREMYFREGAITSLPVDVTQDPLYRAKADEEGRRQPSPYRFLPLSGNTASSAGEENGHGEKGNSAAPENSGPTDIPILGAILRGIGGGLKEQTPRIAEALKSAPSAYVDRKIVEEKARRERRKQEEEERKKQEEVARQEQERVAYWAKRDQEAREARAHADEEQKKQAAVDEAKREQQKRESVAYWEKRAQEGREAQAKIDEEQKKQAAIDQAKREQQERERVAYWAQRDQEAREAQVRIDEEQKKQRAKQEEERNRQEQERLAYWAKQDQAAREARARADEDRRNQAAIDEVKREQQKQENVAYWERRAQEGREAQARIDEERKQKEVQTRNNTGNSVSPSTASTQPVAQKLSQPSPQMITQQPTNGQSGGPVSPSIGTTSPSPVQPSSPPQQNQVRASVEYAKTVPKIEFNAQPITPLPLPNERSLTTQEVTWKNSLPSDIRQRIDQFSPDMIARMKQNGHWDIFVRGVNNDVAALREAKKEEAMAWGEFAFNVATLPAGELKVPILALSKGPTIARDAVKAGKTILEMASGAAKSAAREVDGASTGGITKIVQQSANRGLIFENPSTLIQNRINELKAAIPANVRGRITMSVGVAEDATGKRTVLIGTSEPRGYLRPNVQLNEGEVVVSGTGHAEDDVVSYAKTHNLKLIDIGATRPVCVSCQTVISPTDSNITTPLKNK